ncbi:helix-turn-helix domain-containing protein [Rhodothalassium salexigens]|uniref:helix-turn-helix domain-containing protein n=1 Tax=Rhodothalassium salexigens TaxID=1086 RepID=UPI001914227A|nr:AraC family transcriptional regulator [Rhodothalassium salexigens]
MRMLRAQPGAALQPYIDNIFHLFIAETGPTVLTDRILPQIPTIYVFLDGRGGLTADAGRWFGPTQAVLAGPLTRPVEIVLEPPVAVAGFGLRPSGWDALVACPVAQMVDRIADHGQVAAEDLSDLPARLAGLAASDALALLDHRLTEQIRATGTPPDHRAVEIRELVDQGHVTSTKALSERLGLSARQTSRYTKDRFGIEPKLMMRIARFQRVVARIMAENGSAGAPGDWLYAEYTDHAHFTRDFKHFAGTTPARYFAEPHPLWHSVWASKADLFSDQEAYAE